MSRSALLAVAALCGSRFALAQQAPVPPPVPTPTPTIEELSPPAPTPLPGQREARRPSNDEDAADRSASNLYDEALRSEALGKRVVAQQLAQRALDLSPNGRYSAAVERLLDRLATETLAEKPIPAGDAALGSRIAYVVSGGLIGAAAGALFGGTVRVQSQGFQLVDPGISGSAIAGGGLLGALLGVGLTLASMSAVDDGSMPTHLWSLGILGASLATGAVLLEGPNVSGSTLAGALGAGLIVGAFVGAVLSGTTNLTGGDGVAGLVIGSQLMGEVLLLEGSDIVATNPDANTATQMVGGTILALALVGFIGGELLNHQIHWSGGRWGLVFLSATLGAALGGLLSATTSSGASAALGLVAVGDALGFGVGCVATMGMNPDVSRGTASLSSGELQGRSLPANPRAAFAWTF